MQKDWENEVILITGASSGLGRALALKGSEKRATVIMIARNYEKTCKVSKLTREQDGKVFVYSFDIGDVSKIPSQYETIVNDVGRHPTILINNVGYQVVGFVQNTPIDVYMQNYRVNTIAPVAFIQCALTNMLEEDRGVIANVYSSIMYHAFPAVSSYCASKVALGAIHESLQSELSNTKIQTLCIRPGSFKSNYWENTAIGDRVNGFTYPKEKSSRDPAIVANEIFKAIEQKKTSVNLSTFKDRVGYHLKYWAPQLLKKIIISKNRELIKKQSYIKRTEIQPKSLQLIKTG
ncbi:MAG: SDR family NAD(P)-dependent oxidoreductase [archaeon]|nr:SDR family NAD(P)-dependent oxidoreductase [archaeon]